MVVNSPPVPIDKRPKDLQPFNTKGVVPNTPLSKRSRRPPSFIVAGSKPSTSPLKVDVPSPLWKRMALLSEDDLDLFKGDRVCELIGGTPFYGNVTGAFIKDGVRKTKLWRIKFDHGEEEDITLSQLLGYQRKYENHKQYDTEANTKLPATTTAPTLPGSKRKKKKESTTVKKKAPPSAKKKKKTPVKKKKKSLTEKQKKALAERLFPPKLLDTDGNTVRINNNYTGDEPYPYHVKYKDESTPLYEPIKLNNHFIP